MKVLITGANGFVGKNLQLHLTERPEVQMVCFTRSDDLAKLPALVQGVDFVFHLAGVNRTLDPVEFVSGNIGLTQALCKVVTNIAETTGNKVPIVYTSSTQAAYENAYGDSKRGAEEALLELHHKYGVPVHIFRLPNVFGKWSKPNYNSVVATFCHNITHGIPIKINDPLAPLTLVYVDEVIKRFIELMDGADSAVDSDGFEMINPHYTTTVGQLAQQLQAFKDSRSTLLSERVGTGLVRALYSTYVSYLPTNSFTYPLLRQEDIRGVFVEILKTPDCGQFSYFTIHPGITRGGHYHHSKTEKFLVIKGVASFKFRHMYTHEEFELVASGEQPIIVETIPGWTHDVTNIGDDEMVLILWANEIFDRTHPDTYACLL
jgi:UDP-2-acetamido-2,6-beta-L-arabino-hexul-4-ose reductase